LKARLGANSVIRRKKYDPKSINDGLDVLGITDLKIFDTRIGGDSKDEAGKDEVFVPPPAKVVPRISKTGKIQAGELQPEDMLRYGIPENLFTRKSEANAAKEEHNTVMRRLNEKINANQATISNI
jgi:hypothetical protein